MSAYTVPQILYFFIPAYVGNMCPVLVRHRFASLARPIDGGSLPDKSRRNCPRQGMLTPFVP